MNDTIIKGITPEQTSNQYDDKIDCNDNEIIRDITNDADSNKSSNNISEVLYVVNR